MSTPFDRPDHVRVVSAVRDRHSLEWLLVLACGHRTSRRVRRVRDQVLRGKMHDLPAPEHVLCDDCARRSA